MGIIIKFTGVTEKNYRPRMASLGLKPKISSLNFIPHLFAVSTSPENVIFINQSGIFWSAPVTSSIMWALSIPPATPRGRRGQLFDKIPAVPLPTPTPPKSVLA